MGVDLQLKSFSAISEAMRAKVYKAAVDAAAEFAVQAVRSAVPVDTGATKKVIGVKKKRYRKGAIHVAIVGARAGQKRQIIRTFSKKGKQKISMKRTKESAAPGREVRDPSKTLHLAEKGRKAIGRGDHMMPIRLRGGKLLFARGVKAAKPGKFMERTFTRIAARIRAIMTAKLAAGVAAALKNAQVTREMLGLGVNRGR